LTISSDGPVEAAPVARRAAPAVAHECHDHFGLPGLAGFDNELISTAYKDVLRVAAGMRNVLLMRLLGLVSHRRRRTFGENR
jgi:hypothetical protein